MNDINTVMDEIEKKEKDGIHLDAGGYHKLDSCLAATILHSRETVDTTLVDSPVSSNTQE